MLLYYITGPRGIARVAEAFAAGVDLVQIRAKDASTHELLRLTRQAAPLGQVLVNTRADLAMAANAAGVHLPNGSPPASAYKPVARIVSVACHSVEDVARAAGEGADYALLAPIFDSPGKGPALGIATLERAARVAMPVIALGGVTLANAASCLAAGASGVAAIRLFEEAEEIRAVVTSLRAT